MDSLPELAFFHCADVSSYSVFLTRDPMAIARHDQDVAASRVIDRDEWTRLTESSPLLLPTSDDNTARIDCSPEPLAYDSCKGVLRHDDPQGSVIEVMLALGDELKATVVGYDGEVYRSATDFFFLDDIGMPMPSSPGPCSRIVDRAGTLPLIAICVASPFLLRYFTGHRSIFSDLAAMLVTYVVGMMTLCALVLLAEAIDNRYFNKRESGNHAMHNERRSQVV